MLRLDKYLANLWIVSRREMNAFFKNEMILVNGVEAIKPEDQVEYGDVITRAGQDIVVKEFVYVLLAQACWHHQ
jgi:16S rRNA U516 pseudouridylate synthase RsuA-like enzyme